MTTLSKISDIIADIEKGLTDKDIAIRYNLSEPTIWRYVRLLRENGFTIPKRKRGRKMRPL
jgi:biotin operon repressor